MYCSNCGYKISNGAHFCEQCGQAQNENLSKLPNEYQNEKDNKSLYAFYISILTSPIIFMFRILTQTTESYEINNWGRIMAREKTYLPTGMKIVIFILLSLSIFFTISLRKNCISKDKSKATITTIFTIINIIVAIAVATITY